MVEKSTFLGAPLVFRSNGSNCDGEMKYYAGLQSIVLILGVVNS